MNAPSGRRSAVVTMGLCMAAGAVGLVALHDGAAKAPCWRRKRNRWKNSPFAWAGHRDGGTSKRCR